MSKNKPWSKPAKGRASQKLRPRRRLLICCEDSKSSADYFNSFPIDAKRIEVLVKGTGMNTDSLVQAAIDTRDKAIKKKTPYSEVWCVFDRDSFPIRNYSRAFELARANKIRTAWTNEAFELWYLLHFDYIDAAISRHEYAGKLAKKGLQYDKADRGMYEKMRDKQETAIRNAKKLEAYWNGKKCKDPERQNPSTNVHTLVELLNQFVELRSVD